MSDRGEGTGRTALVTGASAGIGVELSRVFAAHGYDLVLVARSGNKLEALAETLRREHGVAVRAIPTDLVAPGAPEKLRDAVAGEAVRIDVLVNDAGTLSSGPFRSMEMDEIIGMLELNVRALTVLTRHFVAPMIEAGWGRILNMSSIVGAQPLPSMAVYGATKAYIVAFTEALSMELDGSGVTATAFCPGFTSTHMVDEIAWVQPMLKWLPSFTMMEPEEVARSGYAACMRGEAVAVPGTLNRASLAMLRAQPQWLRHRLGALMGRKVAD
jgi:short-subunit dehydrogenase